MKVGKKYNIIFDNIRMFDVDSVSEVKNTDSITAITAEFVKKEYDDINEVMTYTFYDGEFYYDVEEDSFKIEETV